MARRKRKEEHVNHERWLVSYADFITLLFAFFVVMFAASNEDEAKAGQVARSVQEAFSELGVFSYVTRSAAIFDGGDSTLDSIVIMPGPGGGKGDGDYELEEVRDRLETMLGKEVEEGQVRLNMDSRGLTVSLNEAGFFSPGAAVIEAEALEELGSIAARLLELPYNVRVEGHTDDIPISTARFPSNWELSTSRATNVLRYLIAQGSIPPSRLSAVGYGEYRPVAPNDTREGRGLNRRVDIVVLNTSAEKLEPRALAEKTLEETGAPIAFLDDGEQSADTPVNPAGD